MSVTIEDLKPKNFKVKIKGLELESKPLRLSHTLLLAKIGNIFQNPDKSTKEQIKQAEADMDEVLSEIIPELKDIQVEASVALDLITQLMEHVQPSDNSELKEKGVSFDADPKVPRTG